MTALEIPAAGSERVPDLWELEIEIADVVSDRQGIPRSNVNARSRLIEDLHIDSMDMVELIFTLEDTFDVEIPNDIGKRVFVESPVTIAGLAEIVRHQWGTGSPERKRWRWFRARTEVRPLAVEVSPFSQLGGVLGRDTGPLFEPLSPTPGGFRQARRRTDGIRGIVIPSAEVELGSPESTGNSDERPFHRARLDSFVIDAEPVSVSAYSRFLNSTVGADDPLVNQWCGVTNDDRRAGHFQLSRSRRGWHPIRGTEEQPMVLVSWFGAAAYSLWANRRDWRAFRTESLLPTEAPWADAARGPTARRFPWGDLDASADRALVGLHRARESYSLLPLAPVHSRLGMSPFGLHHMAGNIWQWCADWYGADFYSRPDGQRPNPRNDWPSGIRSERGGSWVGPEDLARSSYRRGRPPSAVGRCLGFRCVSDPKEVP